MKNKTSSLIATIMGYVIAAGVALQVIDVEKFDITRDWLKVLLIALIAIGGHASRLNTTENKDENPT